MKLGPRIKRFRILAGLTQQELADKVKSSRAAISLYESDDREPDLQTQQHIDTALDISLGDQHGTDSEQLSEEKIAFARLLESLSNDKRAAVMNFVQATLLEK